MRKIIILKGVDFEREKDAIEASIGDDTIYVLDSAEYEPGAYLEFLHEYFRLKNRVIMRMRICREILFKDQVQLVRAVEEKEGMQLLPKKMSELLNLLDPNEAWRIIILNDDRSLLADITQQLAYINYPLENVELQLEREAGDSVRTDLFLENLDYLGESLARTRIDLDKTTIRPNEPGSGSLEKILNESKQIYAEIERALSKAYELEMGVAVAASKKSGKSVIVNGLLKRELAPTSRQLATPNCCIYRKSRDDDYHLYYKGEDFRFSTPAELFLKIKEEFNSAQYDGASAHTLDNMEIEYVPNGGQFENFTIYDTPGHDAAGTGHGQVAKEAIKECDAAIFAIDYEKYLINSEVEYLNEIKAEFAAKGKFHTLIFVLNKMDRLLAEKGAQSRIGIIDLIRSRLAEIDPQFSDCIIFPISALDYSYACELENRSHDEERLLPLLEDDCDWYSELRKVKREIAEEGEDEDLMSLLTNLESEATRIVDILGAKKMNLKGLRAYSGMPQLMKYISYILHSKAREEIINSITIAVNLQINRLKGILEDQENLVRLQEKMERNARQAEKIKGAIREYSTRAREILSSGLTEKDYEALKGYAQVYGKNKPFLHEVSELLEDGGRIFPLSLESVCDRQRSRILQFGEWEMQEGLWRNFIFVAGEHIARLKGKYVLKQDLELDDSERKRIFERFVLEELAKKSADAREMLHEDQKALSFLMDYRIYELKRLTELCRNEVEKQDMELAFPLMPEFSVTFSLPEISPINMEIEIASAISEAFESLNFFHQLYRNIVGDNPLGTTEYEIKALERAELEEKLNPLFDKFCKNLKKNQVYRKYQTHLLALADNMRHAQGEILARFTEINSVIEETVGNFARLADDSGGFIEEYESGRRKLRLVERIKDVSHDFLDCWNNICGGGIEQK